MNKKIIFLTFFVLTMVTTACSVDSDKLSSDTLNVTVDESYLKTPPQIRSFSEDIYDQELGRKPMVLLFYADWCPTCVWIKDNMTKDLASFPNGTNVLLVDFDKNEDLKIKYEVLVQSVMVFLDSKGNVVTKLAAPDNEKIKDAIRKTL